MDAYEPGQLVVKARIKTVPLEQWMVGRELRKRLARTLADRGIRMPVPHMALRMEQQDRNTSHRDTETQS